jgi:arginase family enzyme
MSHIFTHIKSKLDLVPSIEGILRNNLDNIVQIDNDKNYYENLMKKMKEIMIESDKTYINFSSDRAISASTLSAINKYIDEKYKVIYIDSSPDLNILNYDIIESENDSYQKSVISNLLSIHSNRMNPSDTENIKRSFTKHHIDYNLSQFIFLGLHDLSDYEQTLLINMNAEYYKLENLNKNLERIIDKIIYDNKDEKIIIIFDLSVCNISCAPCVIRENNRGINIDQLNLILNKLSNLNKIKMIDITGFQLTSEDSRTYRMTVDTIIKIYSKLLKLKEYSINVFNESSKFLIYKPLDEIYQEDEDEYGSEETNHGWYILRNLNIHMRNELLEELDGETIMSISIPKILLNKDKNEEGGGKEEEFEEDIEIIIASTSMNEQNQNSYYCTKSYKDMILYPDEKAAMLFELTNL